MYLTHIVYWTIWTLYYIYSKWCRQKIKDMKLSNGFDVFRCFDNISIYPNLELCWHHHHMQLVSASLGSMSSPS